MESLNTLLAVLLSTCALIVIGFIASVFRAAPNKEPTAIDSAALRRAFDPSDDDFLRSNLSGAPLRRVLRARHKAQLAYLLAVYENVGIFLGIAQQGNTSAVIELRTVALQLRALCLLRMVSCALSLIGLPHYSGSPLSDRYVALKLRISMFIATSDPAAAASISQRF